MLDKINAWLILCLYFPQSNRNNGVHLDHHHLLHRSALQTRSQSGLDQRMCLALPLIYIIQTSHHHRSRSDNPRLVRQPLLLPHHLQGPRHQLQTLLSSNPPGPRNNGSPFSNNKHRSLGHRQAQPKGAHILRK